MKKKLLDKLKAKFPGVLKKLTPKGQDVLAEKLSAKITDEEEIEDFVDGLENVIEIFVDTMVSETDRRVKEAVDKVKKPKTTDDDDDDTSDEGDDKPKGNDMLELIKGLSNQVKSLTEQIGAEKQQSKLTKFIETAKSKGITLTEKMAKGYVDAEDFDEETALTELSEHYKTEEQTDANRSAGSGQVQRGTAKKVGEVKEATKEELDAAMQNIKI